MNTQTNQKKIRVLIADDHSEVRGFFKEILQREEAITVVGEAADGAEALQLLDRFHPDVLLLDLSMPVMDGFDVIEAVKNSGSAVHIVVLSSHTLAEFGRTDLVSGPVDAFLNKYEDFDRLVETIETIRQKILAESQQENWDAGQTPAISIVQRKNRRILPDY